MKILITIVHHWNPKGDGKHASLRPQGEPRLFGLQDQLLSLRRLDTCQGVLNIEKMVVEDANQSLRHNFTIKVVTDGHNHVLDFMEDCYRNMIEEVPSKPSEPKKLGFEAHKVLANNLDKDYDLYAYFEDDLIIHDPLFFHKIYWFQQHIGENSVLMPHRYESYWKPVDDVDRFYIDGPMPREELSVLIPNPPSPLSTSLPGGEVVFTSPLNPHSGCFVLTRKQMRHWTEQPWFLDGDSSLVSPLESAATLGLLKTFHLYKPQMPFASFLELQHWGTSFRSLIEDKVNLSTI